MVYPLSYSGGWLYLSINKGESKGLRSGFSIDIEKVKVSHVQYANDALLINASWAGAEYEIVDKMLRTSFWAIHQLREAL